MAKAKTTTKRPKRKSVFFRRKICIFCKEKIKEIDYKDIDCLKKYVNDRGKMTTRRTSGNCAKHQRMVAVAVKRARFVALLPYAAE